MKTILFTSLFLATALFAKPFLVFQENSYDFTEHFQENVSDISNQNFSLIFIGYQERLENNRCSVKILYVVRDSLGQFHNGDQFITNCGKDLSSSCFKWQTYPSGLQYMAGNELEFKSRPLNIVMITARRDLYSDVYLPGTFFNTWGDFFIPAQYPMGYVVGGLYSQPGMDQLADYVLTNGRLYSYGIPYCTKKPDIKNDSLFIKADSLLRMQGKDPKEFHKRLLSGRDSIHIYKYDRPYVAMGAIHAMKEHVNGKDTLCEIEFESSYIFKDSLCEANVKGAHVFTTDNPCNIKAPNYSDPWPYKPYKFHPEPKYNAYKKGACYPARDFKFNRYVFGEKDTNGTLRIDTLLPRQEFLYNEGELVDLRMGFSVTEILKMFYPTAYSYDDAHFYDILESPKVKASDLQIPERQRKEIIEGAERVFEFNRLQKSKRFK